MAYLITGTNNKEYINNAVPGGLQYLHWKEYIIIEVIKHVGIYILNGLYMSPKHELNFLPISVNDDKIQY